MANVRDVDDFVEQLSNCIGEISGDEVVFKKIQYSSEYVVRMRNHNEKVANIWYDYDKDKIIVQLVPAFRNMEYSLDDLTIENIKVIGQLVRKNALNRIGESMEFKVAKNILNENGYKLVEYYGGSAVPDPPNAEADYYAKWKVSDDRDFIINGKKYYVDFYFTVDSEGDGDLDATWWEVDENDNIDSDNPIDPTPEMENELNKQINELIDKNELELEDYID